MTPLQDPYYASVNPDLLARVPMTAQRVLELGCGTGALGAQFRWRQPQVRWLAIEKEPAAAAAALAVLDGVLCVDVETLPPAALDDFLGGEPVDTLVFGDVLEHLREPEAALAMLVERLAPGGTVVACIPNIGHWTILRDLLRGDWTYQESGLLDRSHLRFFTLETARKLLAGAGVAARKVKPRDIPLDKKGQDAMLQALRPALAALGRKPALAEAGLKALQWVISAQKPPVQPIIEVHQTVMVRELLDARVDPPFAALNSLPAVSATTSEKTFRRQGASPGSAKVMVIQRQLVGERESWLAAMRQLVGEGWVLVAEWDDHPDLLPGTVHETWLKHPWMPMTACHACQVSTERLAQAFRVHNPEVAVFENALLDCPPLPEKEEGVVRVLYAAVNRPGVARLISPALDAAGRDPRVEILVVGDEKVFASTVSPRKRFLQRLPYARYLQLLARSDINLMPLRGDEAERYKSPLKFLESASRGTLCIGSPEIYAGAIRHGETGWLAQRQEDFTSCLLRAVENDGERKAMARAAWDEVRAGHLQAHQAARREAWYRDLAARRADLNEALFARHPELRP